jgi:hypothetical protein
VKIYSVGGFEILTYGLIGVVGSLLAGADLPRRSVATSDVDGEGESGMGVDDGSEVEKEDCPCPSVRRLFGGGSSPTATFSVVN